MTEDPLQYSLDQVGGLFAALDAHWHGPDKGMVRDAYSTAESEAHDIVARAAQDRLGCEDWQDLAGNRFLIWPGQDRTAPVIMAGSHLDSVPGGGRYDGPAGVLGALSAMFYLQATGEQPPQDTVLVIWRGEESPAFGQFALGSHLAGGRAAPAMLDKTHHQDRRPLSAHMADIGLRTDALRTALEKGETLLPVERIGALVETHIAQSRGLLQANASLGLVTAVRGNVRFPSDFHFSGRRAHTGAEENSDRADAGEAVGLFMHYLRAYCRKKLKAGDDLTYTFPNFWVENPVRTGVPDLAGAWFESRSLDADLLDDVAAYAFKAADRAAKETGCHWNRDEFILNKTLPARLNTAVVDQLSRAVQDLGISHKAVPSGAGHDASVAELAGVPSGMVFVRHGNDGASHTPKEILGRDESEDPFRAGSDFASAVLANAAFMMRDVTSYSPHHAKDTDRSFAAHLRARGALRPE